MSSAASPRVHAFSNFLLHLRLPFQLLLSPLFLWGVWTAGRGLSATSLGAFVLFHVCLGGGATVFNSYYDRDQGPVACLRHPTPLGQWELRAAVVVQVLGLLGAWVIDLRFGILFALLILVGVVYSHPGVRLKRRLRVSLVLVTLAHGGGAFASGYVSTGAPLAGLGGPGGAFALAAALVFPVGLFPLTQVYQIEEDARRGDITLPVRFGWRAAFGFSGVAVALGGVLVAGALALRGHPGDGPIVASGAVVTLLLMARWYRRFSRATPLQNHDLMVVTTAWMSLAFGGLILFRLLSMH